MTAVRSVTAAAAELAKTVLGYILDWLAWPIEQECGREFGRQLKLSGGKMTDEVERRAMENVCSSRLSLKLTAACVGRHPSRGVDRSFSSLV
jgi:hypothetical protein